MLNEGCRILDEGISTGFKVIDDANMAGMNAPGPFGAGKKNYEEWAKVLSAKLFKTLSFELAAEFGKYPLRQT